jgi:hypothetical protein
MEEDAMTERRKSPPDKKPTIEKLELNKETIRDLTESEAAAAQGGNMPCTETVTQDPAVCHSAGKSYCFTGCGNVCATENNCGTQRCTEACGGKAAARRQ